MDQLLVGGHFELECRNPDGSLAWSERVKNGVTSAGLNNLLSAYLAAGTQTTSWFLGLIDASGFSALAAADTMSSHTGWAESQAYSEAVRQTWTPGAVAAQSVTNPASAVFTANAGVTIQGAFLVSSSTKGGTTGTLWATGAFASPQVLASGQQLKVTYTLSVAGS